MTDSLAHKIIPGMIPDDDRTHPCKKCGSVRSVRRSSIIDGVACVNRESCQQRVRKQNETLAGQTGANVQATPER